MKYNFVILGSAWKLYEIAYKDAIILPNVSYHTVISSNLVLKNIIGLHHNQTINSIINLPLKNIWNKFLLRNKFPNDMHLCFIVFYDWLCSNIGIIESIKRVYGDAKIVIIFNDLIKVKKLRYTNVPLDIDIIKSQVNLILTFDFKEASNYGLTYYPIPYSKPEFLKDSISKKSYDIYFLGQAKNRLIEIMEVFDYLKKFNLRLKFILANVPFKQQISDPEITYVNGIGIDYIKNLEYIKKSKCLLEIMQQNGSGYTSRTLEAIAYGKRLISNNNFLKIAPFYNPEFISVTNSFNDISTKFISLIKKGSKVDYNYIDELSPIKLLEFIESKLNC